MFPEWIAGAGACERMSAAVASVFFKIPLLAPLLTWIGCHPASRENISRLLHRGACFLLPDGVAGVFHSSFSREIAYISNRKGFVSLALRQGASLVPCYTFGHTQLHSVVPGPNSWLAKMSRKLRITVMLFFGRFWTPMPAAHPLLLVFGTPIPLPKTPNPSPELVDEVHAKFVAALKDLYYRRREMAVGFADKELEIM